MFSERLAVDCLSVLGELFEDVEFVFYIRPQDHLLESAYNQQVKQNVETRRIYEYRAYMVDLYSHLLKFSGSSASARVSVFIYSLSALIEGNVVNDFLSRVLGIKG